VRVCGCGVSGLGVCWDGLEAHPVGCRSRKASLDTSGSSSCSSSSTHRSSNGWLGARAAATPAAAEECLQTAAAAGCQATWQQRRLEGSRQGPRACSVTAEAASETLQYSQATWGAAGPGSSTPHSSIPAARPPAAAPTHLHAGRHQLIMYPSDITSTSSMSSACHLTHC
jgi:hypothetical protein